MKTSFTNKISLGAGMLLLAVVCVAWQSTNSQAEPSATSAAAFSTNIEATITAPAPDVSSANQVVTPPTTPANINPKSPLGQIIKLTQANIDQNIILTFITNSPNTFNLDTDKIIYLADIGVPSELVTAMMQHDWGLKREAVTAQQAALAAEATDRQAETESTPNAEVVAIPPPTEVTINYFYDTLSPYGSWVEIAGYGRCWRPSIMIYDSDWQPYSSGGHWIYTDAGWFWQSDYSWGLTFHYGRWFRDARFGWCWWPDTQWSSSWVTWRYAGDYCGWSPLPPFTTYRAGVGFVYRGSIVSVDFDFGLGISAYTFVPTRYLCDPHPYQYRIARPQVMRIYNQTIVVNNFNGNGHNRTVMNSGIAPERISAVTHAPIHSVTIGNANNHSSRGEQFNNRPSPAGNSPSVVSQTQTISPTTTSVKPSANRTSPTSTHISPRFIQAPTPATPSVQPAQSQLNFVHAPAINPVPNQNSTTPQWQHRTQTDAQRNPSRNSSQTVIVPTQNRIGAPYSAPKVAQSPASVTPHVANGNSSGTQKFSKRNQNGQLE